ncbi:MAG: hypothetical protein QW622_01470 [Candidatus Pacearchaeota archaeon]
MQISKIDAAKIRYLIAFEKYTRIKTIECFEFNESLVFVINPSLLKIALAKRKRLQELSKFLNKKVKVLAIPLQKNEENITKFIDSLISPNKIKNVQLKDNTLIINAGLSKALLIGKERKNIVLLKEIFKKYFDIEKIEIK